MDWKEKVERKLRARQESKITHKNFVGQWLLTGTNRALHGIDVCLRLQV